jgi:hypothetical protein
MSRDVDNLLKFSRENFERFVDAGEYSDQDVIDLWCEVKAAQEEIARINCDYYADKQRFVVQRRELEESKAREQKLREAIQTVIEMKELNPEQMATDQKGLYDAAMWFLSGIMDSLYPKEEEAK